MLRHLLFTNIVTSGVIFGIGDYLEQVITGQVEKKGWDGEQTYIQSTASMAVAPVEYLFYRTLDRVNFKGTKNKVVMKKLFFDSISNPSLSGCFIIVAALISGRNFQQAVVEYKNKFWDILAVDSIVWPIANYINFYYLPFQYRLIYINIVTLIYSIIMAHIRKMKPLEKKQDKTIEPVQEK